MSEDRWSDDTGHACRWCGIHLKSGWECRSCASGAVQVEAAAPDPRDGARASYPPLENPAAALAEYIAITTAFDKAQEEERRGGVADDGLVLSEVPGETPRLPVHGLRHETPEGAIESESYDMKRGDAFPGKHLKADDFPQGTRVSVVVDHVSSEVVGSGKDAEEKAVAYFRGKEKGLVLNQTNWSMLEGITGMEDSDNWNGAQCVLYRSTTQFGGKTVPCLRLDPMPLGQQTARTVTAPLGRQPQFQPAPLPQTLPPPETDDYQVDDSDVPF